MKVICITNRHLANEDYYIRIEQILKASPSALLLREKDLPEAEYGELAGTVLRMCAAYGVPCILHTFADTALRLGADALHLPMPLLRQLGEKDKSRFRFLGASAHSVEEAEEAQSLGCAYITASHIYETDCKKGLAPRGLLFLQEVCRAVQIPVYALGGVRLSNAAACIQAGASGVCIMSECMRRPDLSAVLQAYKETGGRNC